MKQAAICSALALVLLAYAAVTDAQRAPAFKVSDAKPGEVRVIATGAIRAPLESVLPQAIKAIGKPIVVQYGASHGNLKSTILAGQAFEVAILLPDVDEELLEHGKIMRGTYRLATVNVGIGVRGDAPAPDISTPAALKTTLLKAKSVKYAPTGAALPTVQKILSNLGIAASIRDASQLTTPVALAPGEYEINIYPISEIVPRKSLKNLGPVIREFQVPLVVEAVIGAHANDAAAARALIGFLQGPSIDAALAAGGMTKDTKISQ